jgi:dihydropteroate synthase
MALDYTININGRLSDFKQVKVMGIVNVTEDSFYAGSRVNMEEDIESRVSQMLQEGADIIDIGACSSRPDADFVSAAVEGERLRKALKTITAKFPDAVVSVDTFRADIAKMAVEEYGVAIINDISAGLFDPQMFSTVAHLGVPYILMHGCTPDMAPGAKNSNVTESTSPKTDNTSPEEFMEQMARFFAEKVQYLRDLGQKDIIIDPGFGFGKTIEQNYQLLANIQWLNMLNLPILVGVSRKSMIYRLLNTTPDEALNGTTAVHTICLIKEACHILRVHDVKAAREAIAITGKTRSTLCQGFDL